MKRGILAIAAGGCMFVVACSVLFDHKSEQCSTDQDCEGFGGHPYCMNSVCVASNLGPDGCYFGTPSTADQFANQCSTATCTPFDNCARLGLCKGEDPPAVVTPPPIDAGIVVDASAVDAAAPPVQPPCVDGVRNTIVIGGSTAIQPFLAVVAPLLAANQPPYYIAYQPSGSCKGVDNLFNTDPTKRVVKDIAGKQALLFDATGASTACTFGSGATLDVAASDVFASSCNTAYAPNSTIAEYLALIQPMTFVVPSSSPEMSISAEMAHVVFGTGNSTAKSAPYDTPSLYFIRNSGSGTQQMIARAINVDAAAWWGKDRGSSGAVRDQLEAVAPANADEAIGILSTDFADPERSRLRILAFQGKDQSCGYYPDSTLFTRDKRNVRDGHYSIWGPEHFFANVTGGVPSAAAGAFVTRFSTDRLDQTLLDAIIKSGLVPTCAMNVHRTEEMGPISSYSPQFQCGCYFEASVPGGAAPASCQKCTGPADCPSATPACNNGYCELK